MTGVAVEHGLKKVSRVFVAEFFLANTKASQLVPPSILTEAETMLRAVVTDLAMLPDVEVTVLLSSEAATRFGKLSIFDPPDGLNRVRIQRGELQSETLPTILRAASQHAAFDAVLLIAPECDGVLVSLLKAVQEPDACPMLSLNLDWRLAEIFADKRRTDVWLRQHGIATISTRTIDDVTADLLQSTSLQNSVTEKVSDIHHALKSHLAVLKPRDGAGADRVRVVQFPCQQFQNLPQQSADNDRWILQPFMLGMACSVGFIGGGKRGLPIILPPARQEIQLTAGVVSYHGGQIPCESGIASQIKPVAAQIAVALGAFHGYVGADLLVDLAVPEGSVRVVEINPRLCTSYVGYRTIAVDNLAAWLLPQHHGQAIRWKPETVTFSANGETYLSSTPTA